MATISPFSGPSPFRVALFETGTEHELVIAGSALLHILCTMLVLRLSARSWVTAKLREKMSPRMAACLFGAYVVGFVHAAVVSVVAVRVVVYERYELWPLTVAYSIGYFISDFLFYALPTRQAVMVVHHVVMIVGHYPTMERPAAALYGAGDPHLIMWLSAAGYLTEISNLFLDVRWFQLKVAGPPSPLPYAANSALLLASYILTRVLIMPLVRARAGPRARALAARAPPRGCSRAPSSPVRLCAQATWRYLVPKYGQYAAAGQLASFYVVLSGVSFISLMSVAYTYILLKPGLRAFLFFAPPKPRNKPPKLD